MNALILSLSLLCPMYDAVFIDETNHCIAICENGHGPSPCYFDGHSTTACFDDDGNTSLCDAEWIVVSSEVEQ